MIKFGPYIVVKGLKTKEFKDKNIKRRCPKCNEDWSSYKFCPDCGLKIPTKSVEKLKKRKPILGEDFLKRETLWSIDFNRSILVPHKKWMKDISFEKSNEKEWIQEFGPIDKEDISFEIKGFEYAFEKELKELRENYESVEIKFGLVNCWDY